MTERQESVCVKYHEIQHNYFRKGPRKKKKV